MFFAGEHAPPFSWVSWMRPEILAISLLVGFSPLSSAHDGIGAAINTSMRANAVFVSAGQAAQERTLSAMASTARTLTNGHNWAYDDPTASSWLVLLRDLNLRVAEEKGQFFPPSIEYRLFQYGSSPYLNFGNDLTNGSRVYSNVLVSRENTRSPNPETRWPAPEILTGELRSDSAHYQCSHAGSSDVRIYGLDALEVATLCMKQARDSGEVSPILCKASATGYTCIATEISTGQEVEFASSLIEGGNAVSCTSGMYFVADSVDPFSTAGNCVRASKKSDGSAVPVSFQQLLSELDEADLDRPINPEIIALISELLWEYAAMQPGYEGVAHEGSGGISSDTVLAGIGGAGGSLPSVGSAVAPVPRSNESANWDVPTTSGPLPSDEGSATDTEGGDSANSANSLSDLVAGDASALIFAVLAVLAVMLSVFLACFGVRIVLHRLKD